MKRKIGFYAVQKGRSPGVYSTWEECEVQIKGFPNARYKGFQSQREAVDFVNEANPLASNSSSAGPSVVPTVTRIQPTQTTTPPKAAEPTPQQKHAKSTSADDELVVYSDGACKGNGYAGSTAGIGVWWGHDDPRNLAERCPGEQTNNRAELTAICRVLETVPHSRTTLRIKTDSKYSINCLTAWLPGWQRNNWISSSGKPVKNAPLIRYIAALLHYRAHQGQAVHLEYVAGHVGIEGNEGADRQANLGALNSPLPERDWDQLARDISQDASRPHKRAKVQESTKFPSSPIGQLVGTASAAFTAEELELYAAGLVDDDELEEDFL